MRLCGITTDLTVFIIEMDDAPPHLEAMDDSSVPIVHRVFERLSGYADPIHGIVLYEELPR
jgi:hypothetical protein